MKASGRKGMGFESAAKSVAKKSGMPVKQARAVVAAGARKASPAAVKANPNLKKVKGRKATSKKVTPGKSLPSKTAGND